MSIVMVKNVGVFDGSSVKNHQHFAFAGNPGNILSADSDPTSTIDGTGCTVIPGLIDAKIDSGVSPEILPLCSAFGITTVIDSSSSCAASQAMRTAATDEPALPSFLATGSAISSKNTSLPTTSNYGGLETITSADEAERVVENKISTQRADYVKVIADQPGLDSNLLSATVRAAHHHGKLVIAHATQARAYALAVDAGFDIISPVPVDGTLDPEVVQKIVARGIGIIPTLCFLKKSVGLWRIQNPEYDFSYAISAVRTLHHAGAIICAGTSANSSTDISVPFGQGLHDELHLLTTAGLSTLEAIRAATSQPTALFGLRDRGLVKAGYRADLVMVDGNPLDDINFLSKIRRVWVQGVAVNR
ncbi:Amidohydrolase 1 [Metarhizium rileyi]|uniref:Amidohydrolase 1 n=1 Tax=Metarhizium rileyi (strain RCEF 4871) TaxID=1649241 RepID=A0A162J620_METRR|nr:Amidohydrolase 1 [Metarhizium rileyi RCEF 4871]